MTASFWLAAALACAQASPTVEPAPASPNQDASRPAENVPPPQPAVSKITDVTVYQSQALVTREVSVPAGDGTVELVVTPLPAQTVDSSLYTEGADGLRVLSTRFRTRAVKDDTRQEVRAKQDLLKKLQADAVRLQKEVAVQQEDLGYLQKLGGFTSTALTGLTEKGRLDSEAIMTLSKFMMENRGTKTKTETELRQQLQANTEATEFATRQLAELSAGTSRFERDAVIVVHKARPQAGTVRLGYLVSAASWRPQYRLRAGAADAPVRLEYLAAVVQHTGESWPGVRVTLSTARPSLDAVPPELLPLKMAIAGVVDAGPIDDAHDDKSQKILEKLGESISMSFNADTPLEDVLLYIKQATTSSNYAGIPIYVDPLGLQEAEKSMTSTVRNISLEGVPLKVTLKLLLNQLDLTYKVKDGLLTITSNESAERANDEDDPDRTAVAGVVDGAMGFTPEQAQASGGARLNQEAATDQAEELHVADRQGDRPAPVEQDSPSVTFSVAGRLDIPSRRDPQLLEVARVDLTADYYAKAVPVLTPRVYRLAKLTNKSEFVLLPGEATVYVGADFVGRMRLPLVAAGEPFIAGFGVDPQLQVSRRLVRKSRSVQGGNQIFDYEFRLGLRNYRPGPVKVQLWDRLPKPQGEAVAVNLVKTSVALSTDPLFQRTARMDNLLRWDIDVPQGTVGDKAMYLNYEFRLEYARDLPRPRFVSGGLREKPIGGGAMGMGGMGGMGGGMRSVKPPGD
jgi:Domain of unknown function (DUF4139)/N-terminal domain of unknown function (DUF4140)